jgi:hypothetical protein
LTASCSAFRFTDDNSCQLYDATYLYKDKTDNPATSVYVQDNLWYQRGKCYKRTIHMIFSLRGEPFKIFNLLTFVLFGHRV